MAGQPGKSGGARQGAGRKPAKVKLLPEIVEALEQKVSDLSQQTPLDFLLSVMRNPNVEEKLRIDAAKTAAQYCHLKKGDGGIKEEKAEKAKKAGAGKFGAAAPPKLIVNNR